jgi:starch phosphorylase
LKNQYKDGVQKLGFTMEDILEQERDAALGNGGLGRLAACYLDSGASQELPLWGYGLRYKYGIFQQLISPAGEQLEVRRSVQSPNRYILFITSPIIGSRPMA